MKTVWMGSFVLFLGLVLATPGVAHAAEIRVCVKVTLHTPTRKAKKPKPKRPATRPVKRSQSDHSQIRRQQVEDSEEEKDEMPIPPEWLDQTRGTDLSMMPRGQTPVGYLRRLMEHFITHEPGYVAVDKKCQQNLLVDLYPLRRGWTVFARYSGHGREEWVDQLLPDEISQFSERAVLALLHNRPISATIKRDTVLRADTRVPKRWVGGTHHFVMTLGTQLRGGMLSTVQDSGSVSSEVRLFSPMTFSAGYRGKFENWAIESTATLGIGTSKTALRRNPTGGHVDMGGTAGLTLHFLRYLNPRGVTSFFMGTGGTFELLWFNVIKDKDVRIPDKRSTILGGGVDVDLVFGWEFMRATSIHWVIQGEVHLPTYVVANENDDGDIHTWLPGASVRLGVLF